MTPDAAEIAEQLVGCLKEQAEQLRNFLELLAHQREAIVDLDKSEAAQVAVQLEQARAGGRRLEQHRRILTARLAGLDLDVRTPLHRADIRKLVAASDASRLDELLAHLSDLEAEIERRQRINRALIEHSRRYSTESAPGEPGGQSGFPAGSASLRKSR
jgi:23S rRNA maturation mini-RNase III